MFSRAGVNLFLFALVVCLALLVYFQSQPAPEGDAVARLSSLDVEAVHELHLERAAAESLRFVRDKTGWWLKREGLLVDQPLLAADAFRMQQLLSWFSMPVASHFPAQGTDLSKYGLDAPNASLTAGSEVVEFGIVAPNGQRRYLLVDGVVHLVPDNNSWLLSAPWTKFVSSNPLPPDARILSIDLPTLGRVQRGEAGWVYEGAQPPQSADDMQTLVDRWRTVQAQDVEFVDGIGGDGVLLVQLDDGLPALSFHLVRNGEVVLLLNPKTQIAYHLTVEQVQGLTSWE